MGRPAHGRGRRGRGDTRDRRYDRAAGGALLSVDAGATIFDTVVFTSAAVLVFARFCRDNPDPIRDYRRLAFGILLISFVPDILLALTHGFGGGWPEALSLMSMHVAVWAICVTILPAAVVVRADHHVVGFWR
jgi:hypothetical protein